MRKRDDGTLAGYCDTLLEFLRGEKRDATLPLDIQATAFQRRVWRYLQAIDTPLTEEDFSEQVPGGLQYRGDYLVPVFIPA